MRICCFSGHRNIQKKEVDIIKKRLRSELINLIDQGVTAFRTGGALGFDTIAALEVLKLRDYHYPQIKLSLILPCKNQADNWNDDDRAKYKFILYLANEVIYASEHYHLGCMHKRNQYLVDHSNICICYLVKTIGGTAYTVDYAKKKGLKIINLAP